MKRITAGLIAGVTLLSSCSPDEPMEASQLSEDVDETVPPEAPQEATETPDRGAEDEEGEAEPEPDADDADLAMEYVRAITSARVSGKEAALELSARDSAAAAYVNYLLVFARADAGQGAMAGDWRLTPKGDEVEACELGECVTYGGFEFVDGLVASHTVNGAPIDGRLGVVPSAAVDLVEGATLTPIAAYKSPVSDFLFVGFRVDSSETPVEVLLWNALYIDPSRVQLQAADYYGNSELRAGATGYFFVGFPDADLGGTFIVDGYADDWTHEWEVEFEVEPRRG